MKISKTHQRFSEELNEPRALTNPEDYLGPNWEDVINFWLYVDTLSVEERGNIQLLFFNLDYATLETALHAATDASAEVVGGKVGLAAWDASNNVANWVFGWITYELLGHHKLLEQGKTLMFLPLCLKTRT